MTAGAGAPLATVGSVPRISGGMGVPLTTPEEVVRLNNLLDGEDSEEVNANLVSDTMPWNKLCIMSSRATSCVNEEVGR